MNEIFDIIYNFLKWLSSITGLTYREVNIVVYFIIIPSFFFYLISRIFRNKYPILIFLALNFIALLIIPDFKKFSNHLFDKSVDFLEWFEIIGLNYIEASVVICVVIPVIIITMLFYLKNASFKTDNKSKQNL